MSGAPTPSICYWPKLAYWDGATGGLRADQPGMPGFIKIGKTLLEDVSQRLVQLHTTGVPFPFVPAFACKVPNAEDIDKVALGYT